MEEQQQQVVPPENNKPTEADTHVADMVGMFAANIAADMAIDKTSDAAKALAIKAAGKLTSTLVGEGSVRAAIPAVTTAAGSWAAKATIVNVAQRAVLQTVSAALTASTVLLNVGLAGLAVAGTIYDTIDPRHFAQMPINKQQLIVLNRTLTDEHVRQLSNRAGGLYKNMYPVEVTPRTYFEVPPLSKKYAEKFFMHCKHYLSSLKVNSQGESLVPPDDPVSPKDKLSDAFLVPLTANVYSGFTKYKRRVENEKYKTLKTQLLTAVPELAVWGLASVLVRDVMHMDARPNKIYRVVGRGGGGGGGGGRRS